MSKKRHDGSEFGEVTTPDPVPPSGDIPVAGPSDEAPVSTFGGKGPRPPAAKYTKKEAIGKIGNILKRLENPKDVDTVLKLAVDLLGSSST